MAVAIASVDLRVGKVNDDEILKNYIEKYEQQYTGKLTNGRVINIDKESNPQLAQEKSKLIQPEDSIYKPSDLIHCKEWCTMHYK